MAVLIGQVYNPRFKQEEKNGKKKTSFRFSLATRKAFVTEGEGPNLFTQCVAHQPGLAVVLNDAFGKEEHKGKSVVLMGHYDEYEWNPDVNNPSHDRYFQEFTISEDILTQGGIQLTDESRKSMTISVPIKQTTRQFVVTSFEFVDGNTRTQSAPVAEQSNSNIKVIPTTHGTSVSPQTDTDKIL